MFIYTCTHPSHVFVLCRKNGQKDTNYLFFRPGATSQLPRLYIYLSLVELSERWNEREGEKSRKKKGEVEKRRKLTTTSQHLIFNLRVSCWVAAMLTNVIHLRELALVMSWKKTFHCSFKSQESKTDRKNDGWWVGKR